MNYLELEKIIKENNSFLLTTHVNPDADAIGCEIALYRLLVRIGKKVRIINYSETPYYLEFFDKEKVIEKYNEESHSNAFNECDVIIALDFNRIDRIVKMEPLFRASKAIKVCLDHHQDAEKFVDLCLCSIDFAATGHLLYDFIKKTDIAKIDYDIALPIYAAIMTDTGSFRFDRTTPEIHRIAAELLETGINPLEVYGKIYDESRFGKIKLLGEAINTIKLYGEENQIAVMLITQEALNRCNALESDTDGFVNLCMTIDAVKMALKFMELEEGFKVSLRSKGKIPVHKFADMYSGGGHANAAGIRIRNEKLEDKMESIIQAALKFYDQYK